MPKTDHRLKLFEMIDEAIEKKTDLSIQQDLYKHLSQGKPNQKGSLKGLMKQIPNNINYCLCLSRTKNDKKETLMGLLFENNFQGVIERLLTNEFSERYLKLQEIKDFEEIIPAHQLINGLKYEGSSKSIIALARQNTELLKYINRYLENRIQKTNYNTPQEKSIAEIECQKIKGELELELGSLKQQDKERLDQLNLQAAKAESDSLEREQKEQEYQAKEAELAEIEARMPAFPSMFFPPKKPIDVSGSIVGDPHLGPLPSEPSIGPRDARFLGSLSRTPDLDRQLKEINRQRVIHPDLRAPEFESYEEIPPPNPLFRQY